MTEALINKDATTEVLIEVLTERARQDIRWGLQEHPNMVDGVGPAADAARAMFAGFAEKYRAFNDDPTAKDDWISIFLEEVYEALAERDDAALRAELIQVVAVGVAWIECIDRRGA